ncbi:Mitochondrial chaperone Frataxin [Modicella reniformis]|uniref:ferroxidase n=1 Tax=Modicella reniformis TaxID=1440133 RepID=A0A9P6J4X5_9FUNG|nr:Mitochondrial chaperone Frataxin [Modicella reniformis]
MATARSLTWTFTSRTAPTRLTLRHLTWCARPASVARFATAGLSGSSARALIRSTLTDDEYNAAANNSMDNIVEYFEDLGDKNDIPGYDVEYQSGVLTLKLGNEGTYVINKQPPNKQLWLSSPITGPKRYDYDAVHKTWFYNRDHHSLKSLLDAEISKAIGIDVDVPLDKVDDE